MVYLSMSCQRLLSVIMMAKLSYYFISNSVLLVQIRALYMNVKSGESRQGGETREVQGPIP